MATITALRQRRLQARTKFAGEMADILGQEEEVRRVAAAEKLLTILRELATSAVGLKAESLDLMRHGKITGVAAEIGWLREVLGNVTELVRVKLQQARLLVGDRTLKGEGAVRTAIGRQRALEVHRWQMLQVVGGNEEAIWDRARDGGEVGNRLPWIIYFAVFVTSSNSSLP